MSSFMMKPFWTASLWSNFITRATRATNSYWNEITFSRESVCACIRNSVRIVFPRSIRMTFLNLKKKILNLKIKWHTFPQLSEFQDPWDPFSQCNLRACLNSETPSGFHGGLFTNYNENNLHFTLGRVFIRGTPCGLGYIYHKICVPQEGVIYGLLWGRLN